MRAFQMDATALLARRAVSRSHHASHSLSRRAFLGGATGAAGLALGSTLVRPATAVAAGPRTNAAPKPTTNITNLNGTDFHLTFLNPGLDPSSITDFNGFVGAADVQGTGTATNPDGSTETLLFDTDMRFMRGAYVAQDGAVRNAAFGFVWLDLYRGQYDFTNFSTQLHDFDPGITPYPDGLFWTVPLQSPDGVDVELGAGKARMTATDLAVMDFFNIPNALFHLEDPLSVGATCSFDIQWSGPVTNRSAVTGPSGSSGELVMNQATMTWSATNANGFSYQSDPAGTTSVFAELGRVRNGVFANG
jgi:hypothetical protein